MVSIACATTTVGDVTLVTLSVSSPEPTHVRIANRLNGPVWPPREQGVPADGWDEDGFSGVVDGTLALGYACPVSGDTSVPPAELVDERPPTEDDDTPTARSLVRDLGDASPPADAVGPAVEWDPVATEDCPEPTPESVDDSPPAAVTAWLDDVADRLAAADRLADATTVAEAADAVEAVGGAEEVCALRDQVRADRAALTGVADRCNSLASDAETVEIPVETLARLA